MSDILIYIERNTGKHTDIKKDKQTDKKINRHTKGDKTQET